MSALDDFVVLLKVATEGISESAGEIARYANMHADVILFRSASESKRVPLPEGECRAIKENVLTCLRFDALFAYLQLNDL